MGYIRNQVWRHVLADVADWRAPAGGGGGAGVAMPVDGVASVGLAVLVAAPVAPAADATPKFQLGIEAQLPDGTWRRFARFGRLSGNAAEAREAFQFINGGKVNESLAIPAALDGATNGQLSVDDVLVTGPVRAVWYSNQAAFGWRFRCDIVLAGMPDLVGL